MYRYAYFHGFASSPDSTKGRRLAHEFSIRDIELLRPDLNQPSFGFQTVTGMLYLLDALDGKGDFGKWRIVGSSFGGYLAALWASLRPDRVDRLVLLAPAFDILSHWHSMLGPSTMNRWRTDGFIYLPNHLGVLTPVHYKLVEDLAKWPKGPHVHCPTLIIHGTADEVIPIDSSRRYAASHPNVRILELPDSHGLTNSLDRTVFETIAFILDK